MLLALLLPALAACTHVPRPGQTSERVGEQVDAMVKAEMLRGKVPGAAVAVLQNGNVLFMKAYGAANIELAAPCPNQLGL